MAADTTRPQNALAASQSVQQDLKFGAGLVIVIAPDKPSNPEDEAYGDWADYLNTFAKSLPSTVKIIRMPAALYAKVFSEPNLKKQYATVFVRDQDHALLHDGRIMEPLIYRSGLEYMNVSQPDLKSFAVAHANELEDEGLTQHAIQLVIPLITPTSKKLSP